MPTARRSPIRSYGKGSTYEVKRNGRTVWISARQRGRDPMTGRKFTPIKRQGRTRQEAIRRADAAYREWQTGRLAAESRHHPQTISQLVEVYKREVTSEKPSPNTRASEERLLTMIDSALGALRISEVSVSHINGMLSDIASGRASKSGKPLVRSTVRRVLNTTSLIFAQARARNLRSDDPTEFATMPRCIVSPERRAFTEEQFLELIAAARRSSRAGPMVALGLYTGMRPGELMGLRWSDIDIEAQVLTVNQSLKTDRNLVMYCGGVKRSTSGPGRKIKVHPVALELLIAHQARQEHEKAVVGAAWGTGICPSSADPREPKGCGTTWAEHDLVFPSPTGNAQFHSNVRREFRKICDAAAIHIDGSRIFPYLMRHTTASLIIDKGGHTAGVADLFGDKELTVSRRYRHRVRDVSDTIIDYLPSR